MEIKHLALGMVNSYLVKNNNNYFLIDTGLAMSRIKLEKALEQEGVKPGDIKLVIITHGDLDHIGNCAYLQKKYGLKIAVHEGDAGLCRTGKTNSKRKRKSSKLSRIIASVRYALLLKPMMKKFPLEKFEPDMILSDGQDFKNIGFDAKVIYIPGHTMGSIGILTAEGDFFSGDTINNRKKPTVANIVENETALAASLAKIRTLSIRNVYPGHGTPFLMSEKIGLYHICSH
jgi:glyoxylase-like metal-dependent hydrolase (beta-lactamase superfamily II)